ncbi:MAG: NAD-dependent deacylase [Planctomycetes bacterium]|nr:NAD-dependent deacylase [Planctomycetota bacterium]
MNPSENDLDQAITTAAAELKKANRVAILTGAGVSAESGVPTFRASDGLWEGHHIEDVASPDGFRRDPKLVWDFYNARRANLAKVKPNPGHFALAKLEERFGDHFALITQNVDGLHQLAGSINVLEIHGSIHRTRCTGCRRIQHHELEPFAELPECEKCGAMLRPDIVWFHEALPQGIWQEATAAAALCDVMLVVGTSAVVHPAASLVPIARRGHIADDKEGSTIIEINLAKTEASEFADIGLYGKSGEVLPRLVEILNEPDA